jgi:hypothetical protein
MPVPLPRVSSLMLASLHICEFARSAPLTDTLAFEDEGGDGQEISQRNMNTHCAGPVLL